LVPVSRWAYNLGSIGREASVIAEPVAAIDAIAALDPGLLSRLSDLEILVLANMWEEARLRPIQKPPSHDWRFCGYVGGRGFGKSLAIAAEITKRIYVGVAPSLAFMAPNDERVEQVQVKALIEVAPPWFKPVRHLGGLVWPNGARANLFTPEAAGRPRGDNVAVAWLTELVDWVHTKRLDAFNNITTATRLGCSQVFWDTTSKGRNDLILARVRENAEDPYMYPIVRGTTFDNPLLSDKYLREEWKKYSGVRREEELFGKVFSEAAGALWEQAWIDDNRVEKLPDRVEARIISIDPALSDHASADEVGMVRQSLAARKVYMEDDLSARMKPDIWGELAVEQHFKAGVGGIVIERNRVGDHATYVIRSRARAHNIDIRIAWCMIP
jgi:phage terminase large subunit-like protein